MAVQVQTLYREVSPVSGDTFHDSHGLNPIYSSDTNFGNIAPLIDRQFISFSYRPLSEENAKNIEDFNLVAVFSNSGLSKNLFAETNDTTEEYDGLNGQIWYSTVFKSTTLKFSLATDGMDEKEITNFIRWFRPGELGELILSEHSNRKIYARVASAPQMEMVPFEKEIEFYIGGQYYKTKTSEYKGTISLSFILDNPFWSAIEQYYDLSKESYTSLSDAGKMLILKTIYEDGIPTIQQMNFLGSIRFASGEYYGVTHNPNTSLVGIAIVGTALVGDPNELTSENLSLDIYPNPDDDSKVFIYYPGTAPSYPIIKFSIQLQSDDYTNNYIQTIGNSHVSTPYSWIKIGSHKMNFTLPGFLMYYNEAVKTISNQTTSSYEDLLEDIRENVVDHYMGTLVARAIRTVKGSKVSLSESDKDEIISELRNSLPTDYDFVIDSKTGKCTVEYTIDDKKITQNCGDMIKSKYMKIDERSRIDSQGYIDKDSLLEISSSIKLTDFKIEYDYMYL